MSPADRPVRPEGDDTPEAQAYEARIARLGDALAEMENRGGVDWTFDDQARYINEHLPADDGAAEALADAVEDYAFTTDKDLEKLRAAWQAYVEAVDSRSAATPTETTEH